MSRELIIRQGTLLRKADGAEYIADVYIKDGRITAETFDPGTDTEVIDARNCLILPGLIDFHCHIARHLSDSGANPDLMAVPNGITGAVDAGSAGPASAAAFVMDVIARSEITVKAFLHVAALGVATECYNECPDPGKYDQSAIEDVFATYPQQFLGLKIRLGRGFSDGWGLRGFRRAKEIAARLGRPICVHAIDTEFPLEELLSAMDRGDVFCHCFHGRGRTILNSSGKVLTEAWKARERGVVFDAAVGRINHNYDVMSAALSQGFLPDVISTDLVRTSVYGRKLFHLLKVISLFMAHGMTLKDAVDRCTAAPAALMGLAGQAGTLEPGARADIAVFRVEDRDVEFADRDGHTVMSRRMLIPQATIINGVVLYKQFGFEFR